MAKIAIADLHLHQPNSLSDLAISEMEQVLGGTSVSYSIDLGPLQNSLSNLSSYFNNLDNTTITVSWGTGGSGTVSSGGSSVVSSPQPSPPRPGSVINAKTGVIAPWSAG
jgi:hypothetical protein